MPSDAEMEALIERLAPLARECVEAITAHAAVHPEGVSECNTVPHGPINARETRGDIAFNAFIAGVDEAALLDYLISDRRAYARDILTKLAEEYREKARILRLRALELWGGDPRRSDLMSEQEAWMKAADLADRAAGEGA